MAEFKHRKLEIWQEARTLVKEIYLLSKNFPGEERFSLTDQIRRAVVSVPSNIAEGSCRTTTNDYIHFLTMARGSLAEVDTQLTLAEDLGYIADQAELHTFLESLAARISSFITYIRTHSSKHPTRPTLQTSNPPNIQPTNPSNPPTL